MVSVITRIAVETSVHVYICACVQREVAWEPLSR